MRLTDSEWWSSALLICCFYNILPVFKDTNQLSVSQPIQCLEGFFITDIIIQQEAEQMLFITLTTQWTVLLKVLSLCASPHIMGEVERRLFKSDVCLLHLHYGRQPRAIHPLTTCFSLNFAFFPRVCLKMILLPPSTLLVALLLPTPPHCALKNQSKSIWGVFKGQSGLPIVWIRRGIMTTGSGWEEISPPSGESLY